MWGGKSMTYEKTKQLRRIYGIALTAIIVIAGICLMAACICIYASGGDEPYSREAVAEAFSGIAFPVYLCLGMIAGSFILDFILPAEPKKGADRKRAVKEQDAYKPASKKVLILQYSVLGAALVCLVYGFIAGGTADVLTKAVNICTECVGLG